MSVNVAYKLTGSGWAECVLEIDGQVAVITASYLSDALSNLLQSAIDLMKEQKDATASFEEEPGEFRWCIRRVNEEHIKLRILWFEDLWDQAPAEQGRLMFEGECRLRTFAGAILSATQQLLTEHGFDGYKEKWVKHDFPTELMNELKRLLTDGRRGQNHSC